MDANPLGTAGYACPRLYYDDFDKSKRQDSANIQSSTLKDFFYAPVWNARSLTCDHFNTCSFHSASYSTGLKFGEAGSD